MNKTAIILGLAVLGVTAQSFSQSLMDIDSVHDPDTAPRVRVDRFSEAAGTLQVRTASNGLPGPNEAINFDEGPFTTRGLGPGGEVVDYYNFDVQSTSPAPIYVLFREGEDEPVEGQLNIVDAIPGDEGYNDFWQVFRVTVPEDYVANSVASFSEVAKAGYRVERTRTLVNCPIVPEGSTARRRAGDEDAGLHRGWYRGQVVFYFTFEERDLQVTTRGEVPVSPIYVTFNTNPDRPGGGPASGFVTEDDGTQTHNVLQTLPSSPGYSPLWLVSVYGNDGFDRVGGVADIGRITILARGVATVNCPVVSIRT